MSFSLPRSPRGLSFTGSVRAVGPDAGRAEKIPTPAASLGRSRPKQTPLPTPSPLSGRLPDRIAIREIEPMSLEEDAPTSSFDHRALDFLSPPPREHSKPKNLAPVFQVRTAAQPDSPATVLVPGLRSKKNKAGARQGRTLMFVMIGLLSMMVGYRFVPAIVDRLDAPPPSPSTATDGQ